MVELNFLLLAFMIVFLLRSAAQLFLNHLNTSYLRQHGKTVPQVFQDTIDQGKLKKISDYTVDSADFGIVSTLANQGFFLAILLSGFLPWLVRMINQWGLGLILGGLVFFGLLAVIVNLLQIPFSLYDTFVIEDRYGFNTKTLKLWITDLFKSLAISASLGGLLLWLLLNLVVHGGSTWWVWAWILVGGVEFLIIWLYPVIIAPLFNRFAPIENKELEQSIATLMGKVGLRAKGVFRMDASKRSKHTNAYFTGIAKSKRIVLFDTLLESHTSEEILAVLAHEIGHWKKKHVQKELILAEFLSLIGFYVVAKLLDWPLMYQTFGFKDPIPYGGLLLVGALFSPVSYFFQPLASAISRRFEREADDFSLKLVPSAQPMVNALKRLAADNLANLTPQPLYAWFYYSHPPLVERISRLEGIAENRQNGVDSPGA
ncbi:MAG: M48 family metallopeptidase [Deltaproteobacteria bacterium]|nr:M48 family metallopeptidase [Deltaproteobacteria bacterium]